VSSATLYITIIIESRGSRQRIRREIYVRERLSCETILDLYGMTIVGVLPSFVYPWMAGGSLHDYLKREYSNLAAHRKLDIVS
jgi:serine/threonine protein kinase